MSKIKINIKDKSENDKVYKSIIAEPIYDLQHSNYNKEELISIKDNLKDHINFEKYYKQIEGFNDEYEIWLSSLDEDKRKEILDLEDSFNKENKINYLSLIAVILFLIGFIIAVIGGKGNMLPMLFIGVAIAFSSIILVIINNKLNKNTNSIDKLIQQELNKSFENANFEKTPYFDKDYSDYISNIFFGFKELPTKWIAEDKITGCYNGVNFEIKEINLTGSNRNDTNKNNNLSIAGVPIIKTGNKSLERSLKRGPSELHFVRNIKGKLPTSSLTSTIFDGIMLTIDLNFDIKENISFVRNTAILAPLEKYINGINDVVQNANFKDSIQTESIEFNKAFSVYCNDELYAFKVLTPTLVDSLYQIFIEQFDKKKNVMNVYYFTLTNDNKMHIFFKTEKDYFAGNTVYIFTKKEKDRLGNNKARRFIFDLNKQLLTVKCTIDSMKFVSDSIKRER